MSATIDTRGRDATLVLPDNSDADIQFTVLDSSGVAVNLTGNTFTVDVLVDGVVELAATMGGTLGSGIITAAFDDDDLAGLPASGLRWRLRNATSEVDWLSGMCVRSSVGSDTEATTEITVRLASSTAVTLVVGAVGAGPAGTPGANGQGVPTGGTTGQALRKTSATDYATEWDTLTASDVGAAATSHTHAASDITSGLATVATTGDYDDLTDKPTIPEGIPTGGTTGQVLTKDSGDDYDTSWQTPLGATPDPWTPDDTIVTTGSLADDATATGTVAFADGWRLLNVATDEPARVRLYVDTDARTADASREIGTDPTGPHGVLLDLVTDDGELDWPMSPAVDGWGDPVPYAITNLSGSTDTIEVTFTWVRSFGAG